MATILGILDGGWWWPTVQAMGREARLLPSCARPSQNIHDADLAQRLSGGAALTEAAALDPPGCLLDHAGGGLLFNPVSGRTSLVPVHESLGVPLVSHFIDPVVTAFQVLDWKVTWQALQSPTWWKGLWDQAQVAELRNLGIPSVFHLRMAAPVRDYDTSPIDADRQRNVVSFVGGQNSGYFVQGLTVTASSLLPGVIAHAVAADMPGTTFYDAYFRYYGLGREYQVGEPIDARMGTARAYFHAKLFFNAALCVRNRDRFVLFLKRHLGNAFELRGRRWDERYGLCAEPPIPTYDAFMQHFRDVAININLVNGNAETGVNMRHFEVTAAGGFLLCYDQPELHDCFDVGRECVAFTSEADLLQKIRYYLEHPAERAEIALAGQRRTLSEHLYSHRLLEVEQLLGHVSKPAAEINAPEPRALQSTPDVEQLPREVPG